MDELKPCPFCGGEAYFDDDSDAWECIIRAHHEDWCPVRDWPDKPYDPKSIVVGDLDCCSNDMEKAIAVWNRRADDADSIDALNRAAGKLAHSDAENRELRELVSDMRKTIEGMNLRSVDDWLPCTRSCPYWESGDCADLPDDECWFEVRMRELGIEA